MISKYNYSKSLGVFAIPQIAGSKFDVKRGNYNTPNDEDVVYFKSVLSEEKDPADGGNGPGVTLFGDGDDGSGESDKYNVDWLKLARGFHWSL